MTVPPRKDSPDQYNKMRTMKNWAKKHDFSKVGRDHVSREMHLLLDPILLPPTPNGPGLHRTAVLIHVFSSKSKSYFPLLASEPQPRSSSLPTGENHQSPYRGM